MRRDLQGRVDRLETTAAPQGEGEPPTPREFAAIRRVAAAKAEGDNPDRLDLAMATYATRRASMSHTDACAALDDEALQACLDWIERDFFEEGGTEAEWNNRHNW